MKIKNLIITVFLLFLLSVCSAQDDYLEAYKRKRDAERTFFFSAKVVEDQALSQKGWASLLNIGFHNIGLMSDSNGNYVPRCEHFASNLEPFFVYGGDVVGGILLLLEEGCITSHIRFSNKPTERSFIVFWSNGRACKASPSILEENTCESTQPIEPRQIILDILKAEHGVSVTVEQDTIDYLYLSYTNKELLTNYISYIPSPPIIERNVRTLTMPFKLKYLVTYIGERANTIIECEEGILEDNEMYKFDFYWKLFDAPLVWNKLDKINQSLALVGLKLTHKRKLNKVYNVSFAK